MTRVTTATPTIADAPVVAEPATACPMCGSGHRVRDPQQSVVHCADCGLVLAEVEFVSSAPFDRGDGRSSASGGGVGPFVDPRTARRKALGSTTGGNRDGQGRRLGWRRRYEFEHLRRVMQRQTARSTAGSLERSQAPALIARAAADLGLPPLVEAEAERMFRDGTQRSLFRGRGLPACAGASLYAACRRYTVPRTLGEVARSVGGRRSEVGRAFKVMQHGMRLAAPIVSTRAFLTRYTEELALSPSVRSTVEQMLDSAQSDPGVSGLPAHGLVAALIYMAADRNGEHRSRAQVARVSAVTEVTLRSTTRLLEKMFGHREPAIPPEVVS
ncbi:MAG: hypothetical protein L3K03_05530 [Thermoplasmata archaeon]|nr:hypothetical protein [Thermoplasmata archaeon]